MPHLSDLIEPGIALESGDPVREDSKSRARKMALKRRTLAISSIKCAIDCLVIAICLSVGTAFVWICVSLFTTDSLLPSAGSLIRMGMFACIGCLAGYGLAGLYPGYGFSSGERLRRHMIVTGSIFLVLAVLFSLLEHNAYHAVIISVSLCVTAFVLPLTSTLVYPLLAETALWGKPVWIIGSDSNVAVLTKVLQENRQFGFIPVHVNPSSVPDTSNTPAQLDGHPIDTAIVITSGAGDENTAHPAVSQYPVKNVIPVSLSPEMASLWMHLGNLQGAFTLDAVNHRDINGYPWIKAVMDRVLGFILFVLFTPVIALLAKKVRDTDSNSPFYSQVRVGYRGKDVRIHKLRSMRVDAQEVLDKLLAEDPAAKAEWEKYYKLKNDPRVISGVGELLRKYSLDELPQFYDVVRGELSLVGPRPFPQYHMDSFSKEFATFRTSVMPGLTGLWQICVRSDGGIDIQEAIDTYYIEHRTLWMDIDILFNTISCVILAKGAH